MQVVYSAMEVAHVLGTFSPEAAMAASSENCHNTSPGDWVVAAGMLIGMTSLGGYLAAKWNEHMGGLEKHLTRERNHRGQHDGLMIVDQATDMQQEHFRPRGNAGEPPEGIHPVALRAQKRRHRQVMAAGIAIGAVAGTPLFISAADLLNGGC